MRRAALPDQASRTGRSRDLDGFRGFAALTVVVFHAWQFCRAGGQPDFAQQTAGRLLGGFDGMISWFFVASAYLLYLPVARRILAGDDPGRAKVFLWRRALRVLPVYWLAILVVWAYRNPVLPGNWRDLLEHLTLTQAFDSERIFYTIGPAWTLSAEVAFYLLVAVFLWAVRRRTAQALPRRRRVALLAAPALVLVAGSQTYKLAEIAAGAPLERWAVWFNPLAWADNFALGMLLALLVASRGLRPLAGWRLALLRLVAVALVVGMLFVPHGRPSTFVLFHSGSALGYTLLLASSVLAAPTSLWRQALGWRPLASVGAISFSFYVWHEPLLLLLDRSKLVSHDPAAFPAVALTLVVLGLGAGWLAYQVFELPLRRLALLMTPDGRLRRYYPEPHEPAVEPDPEPAVLTGVGGGPGLSR